MDVERLESDVSKRLPLRRFDHVLRVSETAKKLADHYGVDIERIELAALLHDIAKFMDKEKLREKMVRGGCDERLLTFHHELWHGPVGAIIAREQFNIEDEDILNAIRYHTTGRAGMSEIEKIIYIADLIEPGRDFPGIEALREIAFADLNHAMGTCIQHTLGYLISKGVTIFPDSIACYNEQMVKRG